MTDPAQQPAQPQPAAPLTEAEDKQWASFAHLGGILGIEPADMVAFGDGGNDLEMLQLVGRGVAMANAPEPVKAVADDLAASNNDQGVLAYLEQLGL